MKRPVEVTLTKVDPPSRGWHWWRDDDLVGDGDVGVVRIGRNLAVVDTAFSETDEVTKRWLAEAIADARGGRLRAPLVAGLVALRGHDPAADDGYSWWSAFPGFRPSDPDNPIRCVALCLGGSRVLVYQPNASSGFVRRRERSAVSGRLVFYSNNMNQLRAFLDDKRITVACVGAREAARKLAREWGLHVARPEELTDLFARAYGKEAGVDAEKKPRTKRPEKFWLGKAALARERAKAEWDDEDEDEDEEGSDQGNRPAKVVRGVSLERMARVALGQEMRLARWPAKVANADWGGHRLSEEDWMYATRDAYLCFEIAARCLQKLGVPIGG